MTINFEVSAKIPASAEVLYGAWLDSDLHTAMTGGEAHVSDQEGESFTAWDGYIRGENIELDAPNRIVQRWRTVEFDDADGDSRLEVFFESGGEQTLVRIKHSNLPDHGLKYKQGWVDNYFTPMTEYFGSKST